MKFPSPVQKTCRSLITGLLIAITAATAWADREAGPRGGRLLPTEPNTVEFFVTADNHADVVFYSPTGEPVSGGDAQVTLIAEAPGGRVRPEMQATEHGFRSVEPLPDGMPYRVVLQVRKNADARPQNFRMQLEMHICGGCDLHEYACICEGH